MDEDEDIDNMVFDEYDEEEEREIRKIMASLETPEGQEKIQQEVRELYTNVMGLMKESGIKMDMVWSAYCKGGIDHAQRMYDKCRKIGKAGIPTLENIIEIYEKRQEKETSSN